VRLLLVEDDAAVAEMFRLKLELDGHHVTVARDGLGALAAIRSLELDLVLLDMEMPGPDGLSVLAQLRHEPRTAALPVLVLSNSDSTAALRKARSLGILGWVVKSRTTPTNLANAVRLWALDQSEGRAQKVSRAGLVRAVEGVMKPGDMTATPHRKS
jgi:CheY-like chemotaxis protein